MMSSTPRVTRVIEKARTTGRWYDGALAQDESVLSHNRVTGYSVNVPIWGTCHPSKLCLQTCYFACGASTWPASLKKQIRIQRELDERPLAFASRVVAEYRRRRLDFLRWNGGGDLTAGAVTAINQIGHDAPDVVLWVVTRIPRLAALIDDAPNIYVHFSLDRESKDRAYQFMACGPRTRNFFFSYQAAPGENPTPDDIGPATVVFYDNYKPPEKPNLGPHTLCPLNLTEDISGVCRTCRRCFNGDAVRGF